MVTTAKTYGVSLRVQSTTLTARRVIADGASTRRTAARALLLAAGVCFLGGATATACGDNADPPMEKVLETEHFVYVQEVGLSPPCPAVGELLEGYHRGFEAYLGVTRPTSRKITYKLYAHPG